MGNCVCVNWISWKVSDTSFLVASTTPFRVQAWALRLSPFYHVHRAMPVPERLSGMTLTTRGMAVAPPRRVPPQVKGARPELQSLSFTLVSQVHGTVSERWSEITLTFKAQAPATTTTPQASSPPPPSGTGLIFSLCPRFTALCRV